MSYRPPKHTFAAIRTWNGAGTDGTCGGGVGDGNKWSCANNWVGGLKPGASDVATFDATSTKTVTIDSGLTSVGGIDINVGFTGIINQASGVVLSIGASGYDQADGTFNGSDSNITSTGAFNISAGSFTSTSATLKISLGSALNITFGVGITFNNHSGTFEISHSNAGSKIFTTNGVSFYNLKFSATALGGGAGTIRLADNVTVENDLTVSNDAATNSYTVQSNTSGLIPTISVAGNVNFPSTANTSIIYYGYNVNTTFQFITDIKGDLTISDSNVNCRSFVKFTNTLADQNISHTAGTIDYGDWTINQISKKTILTSASLTIGSNADFIMTSGTFDMQDNSVTINGDYSQSNGTFIQGGGALIIGLTFSQSNGNFSGGSGSISINGLTGTEFNLTGGIFTSTSGNLTINYTFIKGIGATFNHNNGTIIFKANMGSSFTITTNNCNFQNVKITTATALNTGIVTITLADNFTVENDLSFESVSTINGIRIDGAGAAPTITVNGNLNFPSTAETTTVDIGSTNFNIILKGNFLMEDSSIIYRPNTSFTNTLADQTISATVGTISTGTWTIDKTNYSAIMNSAINLSSGGKLTLTSGKFYLNGNDLTVNSTFTNNATLKLKGKENLTLTTGMDFDSGIFEYAGYNVIENINVKDYGVNDYYSLTINDENANRATFQLAADLNVDGNLSITSGTLDITAANWAINVAKNFSNTGTFNGQAGTVTIDGTGTSVISGSTTFNNLSCTIQDKTLSFDSGSTQTINGTTTLTGAAGHLVNLTRNGGAGSNQWMINPVGARVISFVNVSNSNNINSTVINPANSTNSGNNSNWFLITISGTAYLDKAKTGNIGANKTIGLSINGGAKSTVLTVAGGVFTFNNIPSGKNYPVVLFIDDEVGLDGTIITTAVDDSNNIVGLEIYANEIVIRHESTDAITNTLLAIAATIADNDLHFSVALGTATFDNPYEVYLTAAKTYQPGGNVNLHDIDIRGNFLSEANNITFSGDFNISSGALTSGNGNINVAGNFLQTGGTVTAPTGNFTFTGNFSHNAGVFNHNNGSVILDGADQNISGTTTFNNFTKNVATTRTLKFEDGKTQTFLGNLSLKGNSDLNRLLLRSSIDGNEWFIDPQGARDINFADVMDSNNQNMATIDVSALTVNNSGHNTNWLFAAVIPPVVPPGGSHTPTPTPIITPTSEITPTPVSSELPSSFNVSIEGPSRAIVNTPITFNSIVSGANGVLKYNWKFGDGTTNSSANALKTYSVTGSYTVSLTVSNTNNNFDITTLKIDIVPPAPSITNISRSKEILNVNGKSVAGADIDVTIKPEDLSMSGHSDIGGDWIASDSLDLKKLPEGRHTAIAVATDENNMISDPSEEVMFIINPEKIVIVNDNKNIVDKIKKFFEKGEFLGFVSEKAPRINPFTVSLSLVLTILISIFQILVSLPSYIIYLINLFLEIFGLRKKRKPWGVVYNSVTKAPIGLAIVRIYNTNTKKLLETKVTDKNGRFGFIVTAGNYYITIAKSNHIVFSKIVPIGTSSDDIYLNIYHGGPLNITNENNPFILNIPIDPKDKALNNKPFISGVNTMRTLIGKYIFYINIFSLAVALISYNISKSMFDLLAAGLLSIIIVYDIYKMYSKFSWGVVYDSKTKLPISGAIVKIFDTQMNKLRETKVTNSSGKYGFLVPKGKYYIQVIKNNYSFPSKIIHTRNDGKYSYIYHGEIIEKHSEEAVISSNIALDPKENIDY